MERALTESTKRSPQILAVSWGRMEIEGMAPGKDFKLYPGGGRAWDWSETGPGHSPGIPPVDVEDRLVNGSTVVVLSPGPGSHIVLDLPVELPGKREQIATRGLPEFVALRAEVGRVVRGT